MSAFSWLRISRQLAPGISVGVTARAPLRGSATATIVLILVALAFGLVLGHVMQVVS